MLINEICKKTNLTKKAVEYYIEQGLLCPIVLENGYRDFDDEDVLLLEKISVLRKLDVSTDNIHAVLTDKTNTVLQRLSVEKELNHQRQEAKKQALDLLSSGKSYESISALIKAIDQNATITEKILDAFPGYCGRIICIHFARFLNNPITCAAQQEAYEKIVEFFDSMPAFNLPEDLQEFLIEATKHIGTQDLVKIAASTKETMENPDEFFDKNKEMLEEYAAYKQTEEYKNLPFVKIQAYLRHFNSANGYNEIFIPMMKQLSPDYANYYAQMEKANEKFLEQFPSYAALDN